MMYSLIAAGLLEQFLAEQQLLTPVALIALVARATTTGPGVAHGRTFPASPRG